MKSKFSAGQITKSLLFRTLTYRAAGFLGKPLLLFGVVRKALTKAEKDASLEGIAKGALDSVKRLGRLIKAYADGSYRDVERKNLILVIAAILYFISPLDLIPDAIPFIGLLDDITLMSWVIKTIGEELTRFESFEDAEPVLAVSGYRNYRDLYEEAKELDIPGRSTMNREELQAAVDDHIGI